MNYELVILGSWAAFFVVWIVSAFNVKQDVRGGAMRSAWYRFFALRMAVVAVIIVAAARLAAGTAHVSHIDLAFSNGFFATPPALGWFAAACAALGIAFAIWARLYLGRNWSPAPAVKRDHELVIQGPYRFVRHPIYTGVLLAAFGSALTGSSVGIVIFIIVLLIFLPRLGREERIMLELFPNEYPAYQARTKRLIPFVW